MEFVTVKNIRLGKDYPYEETINIEHIVSFTSGGIDLDNGQYIPVDTTTNEKLKHLLFRKYNVVKLED